MTDALFKAPFAEQLAYFRGKLNLPTERWDDILGAAHDRAFIVAGAMQADLLDDLRGAVDKAIAQGTGLEAFRRDFARIVRETGWDYTGGFDWRTRVIYQTNLRASYAAGRWAQLNDPALLKARPYWRYVHSDAVAHPRPLHLAWNGLVLRHDDPWWQTHFPPNGWGCQCRVVAATEGQHQAAKKNRAPDDGTWTHIDSRGVEHSIPNGIDYGWAHAPGRGIDTALREVVAEKLIRYPEAITKALTRDINRYVEAHTPPAQFAARALADVSIEHAHFLGFPDNFRRIKDETGFDVRGYIGVLPGDVPRHVENDHKYDGGDQRPPLPADYNQVWRVLTEADLIEPSGRKSVRGLDAFVAFKTIGGETYRTVWEIRSGKKTRALALISLVVKTR